MRKRILILAYYSFNDPVFQSAVLPYFQGFPDKEDFTFVLLTFEQKKFEMTNSEISEIEATLRGENILWYRTKWNSGNFKIFKKAYDLFLGLSISFLLIVRYKIQAVYSEGFPGALIGYYVAKISRRKHMIHTFEPHADYMVEAGIWLANSWETKLLKLHEKLIARHAFYIFTATNGMIENLKRWGIMDKAYRVPSCVDLSHFRFDEASRRRIREENGISEDEVVVTYLGKFGGMYMDEEIFEFFGACSRKINARFLVITQDEIEKIKTWTRKHRLEEKVILKSLARSDVPEYLSASDFGFVAVRQRPSKRYCSPIKTGEYLACGLPVIIPLGISDDDFILKELGLAIIMKSVKKEDLNTVIDQIRMWNVNSGAVREAAYNYVKEDRSIEKYKRLYGELFSRI